MITRGERMRSLARRMQSVFEVRWDPGVSAGEAFEAAKATMIRSLQTDLQLAEEMDFRAFATGYMPPNVDAGTIREEAA